MKNKEFFKEQIFEIACEHGKVAVVNGEPVNCRSLNGCTSCDFYISEVRCKDGFKDWLEKEHEEQKIQPEVKSLKKDDRVLVSNDGLNWENNEFEIEEIAEETPENNNGWIPVSKGNIPDHEVLACNEDGCELIGYIDIVGYGFFCEERESGICMYDVVAWMEKPEPYRPEMSEGE